MYQIDTDHILETSPKVKELYNLNKTLSKALAEEIASNFAQSNLRKKQDEKLERIQKEVDYQSNSGLNLTALKKILNDE